MFFGLRALRRGLSLCGTGRLISRTSRPSLTSLHSVAAAAYSGSARARLARKDIPRADADVHADANATVLIGTQQSQSKSSNANGGWSEWPKKSGKTFFML